MQYEMSIRSTSGLEVMAKVKVSHVFVHATDAEADGRTMTLTLRTYLSRLPKNASNECITANNRGGNTWYYMKFNENDELHLDLCLWNRDAPTGNKVRVLLNL